jgi:hypothetical protein
MTKVWISLMALLIFTAISAHAGEGKSSKELVARPMISLAAGNSGIFDRQTLDFIGAHAGLARLNIPVKGHPPGTMSYSEIVSRLHAENPDLQILLYTWGFMWTSGGHTIAHDIGKGYPEQLKADSALETRHKAPASRRRHFFIANPQSKGYREHFRHWIIGRIKHYLKLTGANGIMLDAVHRTPGFIAKKCRQNAPACKKYHSGVQSFLRSLSKAIKPGKVFFNGLWNRTPGQLDNQLKLLPFADGAIIEFFGRNRDRSVSPFSKGIAPFLKIIAAHPGKAFMVNGRGSPKYTSYRADYSWQRYLYAAYLLVGGPRTYFHYNSGFTVPARGRANGMAWYADWDLPLGAPLGPYVKKNGLYIRQFARALVLLVPSDGVSASYSLDGRWYTPEGKALSGTIKVAPGQGLLLSRSKPQLAKGTRIDFEDEEPPGSGWQGAGIKTTPTADHYLALSSLPQAQTWRHDLMLDFKHSLDAPRCVHLKLRSHDKDLRVFLVAAVDDKRARDEQAVVELVHEGSDEVSRRAPAIRFRNRRPYGKMPYIVSSVLPQPDGDWHNVDVCANSVFGKQKRYQFKQWQYARIKGGLDMAYVHVSDRTSDVHTGNNKAAGI